VALREGDTLVALNGGGPGEGRLLEVAHVAEAFGARVHTIAATYPSELLSVFPLTAAVQRIALECAEALGTNPDSFGRDLPGRAEALEALEL
jgi:glucosamine--fructose-6-phosphate aminotransferase (isomerizing)